MFRIPAILFFLLSVFMTTNAQENFSISLEPLEIENMPGIQSFAYGEFNGKWIIFGGRVDGLHRRQPWATFDLAGFEDQIWLVDIENETIISKSLDLLDDETRKHLSSTNMEFEQKGNFLYALGGYGYDEDVDDHITFSNLTAIDMPGLISAMESDEDLAGFFRTISDDQFAVTGGQLYEMDNVFYLVGGQKFDGLYNPHNNPTFVQEYTNQVRRFTINDDGTDITIEHLESWTDENELHRRDYNVLPQVMPDGTFALTAFSGVFQNDADVPWLNSVNIDADGYAVNDDFNQYYNHYHCARTALYSDENNEMHNIFFGGIAQYYDNMGTLVVDDEVPFVKTVARVTRNSEGQLAEYLLPVEMPGYLGASAEFIPLSNLPTYSNDVIKYDELEGDSILIGYVVGGINSTQKNIFWINDGTQSTASSTILEVYLIKGVPGNIHQLNEQSSNGLGLQIYPNPADDKINLRFSLDSVQETTLNIYDMQGKLVHNEIINPEILSVGMNHLELYLDDEIWGQTFMVILSSGGADHVQKLIINDF